MMLRSVGTLALLALVACGGSTADETTPAMDETASAPEMAPPAAPAGDVVDVAVGAGTFNTLAQALTAAGLIETLKSEGPFTVFAPTDEAFAKIPAEQLQALLANKEELTKVLTYHVVAGSVPASQVTSMSSAETVEGRSIAITIVDGKVVLNGNVNVTATDVAATNGVIHVIDAVLMPPAM